MNLWFGDLSKNDVQKFSPGRNDNLKIFQFTIEVVPKKATKKYTGPIKPANEVLRTMMSAVLDPNRELEPNGFTGVDRVLPNEDYIFFAANWNNNMALIKYFSSKF